MEEHEFKPKVLKTVCCRSYLTPKGRCYTCPEPESKLDDESYSEEE
ncbi:MAG: hypothetical protein AABX05_01160 [Nanoarchaeota archaeon]